MRDKNFNISIFSYNVFWKIMYKSSKIKYPLSIKLNQTELTQLKSNIFSNISNVINYYNPFIYCFQESESFSDIIKLFSIKNYDYHLGYSNPEHILTIWRKDIMKKKHIFDGEFETGRPFSIILFKDLRYNIYWILINIHAGHNHCTISNIFEPLQHILNLNNVQLSKYDIKRIAIIGDFNRDISSQIAIEQNKYKLKINNKEYKFNYLNTTNKTCCSLNGWGYKLNYDQIIDSYNAPILIHQLNKESWYVSKSSDHLAILTIIKNFF